MRDRHSFLFYTLALVFLIGLIITQYPSLVGIQTESTKSAENTNIDNKNNTKTDSNLNDNKDNKKTNLDSNKNNGSTDSYVGVNTNKD